MPFPTRLSVWSDEFDKARRTGWGTEGKMEGRRGLFGQMVGRQAAGKHKWRPQRKRGSGVR